MSTENECAELTALVKLQTEKVLEIKDLANTGVHRTLFLLLLALLAIVVHTESKSSVFPTPTCPMACPFCTELEDLRRKYEQELRQLREAKLAQPPQITPPGAVSSWLTAAIPMDNPYCS